MCNSQCTSISKRILDDKFMTYDGSFMKSLNISAEYQFIIFNCEFETCMLK